MSPLYKKGPIKKGLPNRGLCSTTLSGTCDSQEEKRIEKKIESIKSKDQKKVLDMVENGKLKKRPSIADVEAGWKKGFLKSFPTDIYSKWNPEEKRRAKNLFKGMILPKGLSLVTLFEWIGENWLFVVELEFDWMGNKKGYKSAPSRPQLPFLGYAKADFLKYYNLRGEFDGKRKAYMEDVIGRKLRERGYLEEEIDEIKAERKTLKEARYKNLNPGAKKRPVVMLIKKEYKTNKEMGIHTPGTPTKDFSKISCDNEPIKPWNDDE